MSLNLDPETIEGFGDEWRKFDQSELYEEELQEQFIRYFRIFPWNLLAGDAIGFDMGCGSGRWAKLVAPRIGRLYCVDASSKALETARENLQSFNNCQFILASVGNLPIEDNSMDFGYSLGVLHHIPDTASGIKSCVDKLKPGAPFLLYLYYAFDNRRIWYRWLWRLADMIRRFISKLPFKLRFYVTQFISLLVYFPLARASLVLEKLGLDVDSFPLSYYRKLSFYTMRTDALDRFGTKLEQRFTASETQRMMTEAGLEKIQFSDSMPYWCVVGYKSGGQDN
jgi:SAM-dependent methyltransferase